MSDKIKKSVPTTAIRNSGGVRKKERNQNYSEHPSGLYGVENLSISRIRQIDKEMTDLDVFCIRETIHAIFAQGKKSLIEQNNIKGEDTDKFSSKIEDASNHFEKIMKLLEL